MSQKLASTADLICDSDLAEIENFIASRLEACHRVPTDAQQIVDRVRQELDKLLAETTRIAAFPSVHRR